jgi:hypothetical protein
MIGIIGLHFSNAEQSFSAGVTYYVDQTHPQADDSNPGTEGNPWATIQHAANIALNGDTIYIKSGIYPERVRPQNSGSPGNPITFIALPRRSVTMWGFYLYNSDYLHIEGFNITPDISLTDWTDQYGIFIRSNHVEIVDNYLYDWGAAAIQGYWHEDYPEDVYIAKNKIYRSQKGIGITGFRWIVDGNEVNRLYDHGGGDCDYSRFFGDDHIIRGNYFHGTNFDEIGSAHVDCFQTFDNNGEFGHNITVDGNLCTDFHQGFMGEAHYYHDISHITFKNNIFAHGGAWGLAVQDISYLTAVNNTFVDIQHHGIGLSGPFAHNGVIINNIFYDTGTSYWFPENSNSYGDHNLIYGSNDPPVSEPNDLIGFDPMFVDVSGNDFHLLKGSPAIESGAPLGEVTLDFDGVNRPQIAGWDIGAYEYLPELILSGTPADRTIVLNWTLNTTLPFTSSWDIVYVGPAGDEPSPITNISHPTHTYTMTGMTNYTWYDITLNSMLGEIPILSDTLHLMATDLILFFPTIFR